MERGSFHDRRRRSVAGLAVSLGVLSCSPKSGHSGPAAARLDAGHPVPVRIDSGTLIHGIKGPPDAALLRPGEGGIRLGDLNAAKKLDMVFMVDDSTSMADKQQVLKAAIPDLLNRFVNPVCLDKYGMTSQPATADAACPPTMNRQFSPVRDIHIGLVTSSLGTADTPGAVCSPTLAPSGNDGAHFAGTLARAASVPTYPGGFLVWDPDQKAVPPGQSDVQSLVASFRGLVDAIGQAGCGYENQLEAWYRLLVDPEPRVATRLLPCSGGDSGVKCARPDGIDQAVLDQRKAFLRPDSLLVIVMLTDENDCSMTDDGALLLGGSALPPQGAAACATNPDDPCCYPCILPAPAGCPNPDPVCAQSKMLKSAANLNCFDGKRRFGFDPLRPVERYIDALTKTTVPSRSGAQIPNPLFAGGLRTPSQIFLVAIAGVPWQDVATDATRPAGVNLQLKSSKELRDGALWDVIAGDPATHTPPKDPLMTESVAARTGANPITGDALASPTAGLLANPINGHERLIQFDDDLQYSCIFQLPATRDCAASKSTTSCDCTSPTDGEMNPVCQAADGTYTTTQRYAKALPPLRILQVVKGVGDAGIVASICPKNIVDDTSEGYGYRPVIGTLVQNVAPGLIR